MPPGALTAVRSAATALLAGLLLAIALLKFGNPVIFQRLIPPPDNALDLVFQAWPVAWSFYAAWAVAVAGLYLIGPALRRSLPVPRWPTYALIVWFVWQCLSATQSVSAELTIPVLKHFSACLGLFFFGYFCLSQLRAGHVRLVFWVWLGAYMYVLWVGFEQHYGGLEATRRYIYENMDWQRLPADYLRKLQSNRIFGTLIYPNTFAGAILLAAPPLLWLLWTGTQRWGVRGQLLAVGLFLYASAAALYWSGSKAGWLIALLLGAGCLVHARIERRQKFAIVATLLVAGSVAFLVKYSGYFQRGAPSAGARLDYWQAALTGASERPILGSGPGTFWTVYKRVKKPESEPARLAHNDYLQQASDSGLISFLAFLLFFGGSFTFLYRYRNFFSLHGCALAGVAAYACQSALEFNLYVPALSWPVFLILGWLWGTRQPKSNPIDIRYTSAKVH